MVAYSNRFLTRWRVRLLALFLSAVALSAASARAQQQPRFTSIERDGRISWTSQYAVAYQLQKTTRLDSGAWINVGSPLAGNGGTLTATDPAQITAQAFYRVVASNAFSCVNSGDTNCSTATTLSGYIIIDRRSGFLCTSTPCDPGPTVSGCGSGWFRLLMREDSNCSGLRADIALDSPPGLDYDLYVYRDCGTLVGLSRLGAGARDSVIYQPSDTAADDGGYVWIEVRYFSGTGPGTWTLLTSGGAGPCY